MRRRRECGLLIVVTLIACDSSPEQDQAPDAQMSFDGGTVDAGSSADAGLSIDSGAADAGVPDSGGCRYGDLTETTMPLAAGGPVPTEIGDPSEIAIYSAVFEQECVISVVWETYDEAFQNGRLVRRMSSDLLDFGPREVLDLGTEAIQGNPSRVVRGGTPYLYFAKTEGLQSPASTWRAAFTGGGFSAPQATAVISGASALLAWPRFVALRDDSVVVAYRDGTGRPFLQSSTDGLGFGSPVRIADESIAIPTVAQFATGRLAFTFQIPGQSFAAYFSTSDDGVSWSPIVALTGSSTNVHDAILVLRSDGDLDAYYIYPTGAHGFSIHRRALSPDGTLGPEQTVTTSEHGNAQKPKLERLSDGSLLMTYTRVTATGTGGAPTALALTTVRIVGDAPR